jgi:hypothetical protein
MLGDLITHIRALWHRTTASRYVQALETEILRLRAENRALMNSILGVAGIPPVVTKDSESSGTSTAMKAATNGSGNAIPSNGQAAQPLRKRSWQQINRALEIESARKKDPGENSSS